MCTNLYVGNTFLKEAKEKLQSWSEYWNYRLLPTSAPREEQLAMGSMYLVFLNPTAE